MSQEHFSDEQLTAYLDGELEQATHEAITQALARDSALSDRIASLDLDTDAVKADFDALLAQTPNAPDFSATDITGSATAPRTMRWGGVAALCLIAAGIGSATTSSLLQRSAPGQWTDYVAAYHALYVTDTLQAVQLDETVAAAGLARAAGAINLPLTLDAVTNLPGVQYKRAQVLGYAGLPLAQLTYLTKDGVPIAFCIYPKDSADSPLSVGQLEGMATASWTQDGHAYLVIGGSDSAYVEQLAHTLTARL